MGRTAVRAVVVFVAVALVAAGLAAVGSGRGDTVSLYELVAEIPTVVSAVTWSVMLGGSLGWP